MNKNILEIEIESIDMDEEYLEYIVEHLKDIQEEHKDKYESIMVIQNEKRQNEVSDVLRVIGIRLETDQEFEDRTAYFKIVEDEQNRIEKNRKDFPVEYQEYLELSKEFCYTI
jgi:hypothetical protein